MATVTSCQLSLTLQYFGLRFQRFVRTLQTSREGALPDSIPWYDHVQGEVVYHYVSYHFPDPDH